jgi:hypothetical protein
MNRIDFTQPNGFPLEANTLDFMQSDYQNALKGMSAFFGDFTIISGLTVSGGLVSDGWILVDGELVYFQGGTLQGSYYIELTVVKKANQNGALIERYYTKKARFGTSIIYPQYDYYQLQRLPTLKEFQNAINGLVGFENAVILSGCEETVTGANIAITAGFVYMDGDYYVSPPLTSTPFPVFLKRDGSFLNWVSVQPTSGTYVAFTPHSSQKYKDVLARKTAIKDEIRTVIAMSDRFDATGLGKWNMFGWAVCNGQNGTVDLQGKALFGLSYSDSAFGFNNNIDPALLEGGSKTGVLAIENMPEHNHTGGLGVVGPGELGLIQKSTIGQNVTISGSVDAIDSGVEPNLRQSPFHIPMQGEGEPFPILPPYKVVVFIQRI